MSGTLRIRKNRCESKDAETHKIRFRQGKSSDFPFIKRKAMEWDLDMSSAQFDQFLVAEDSKNQIVGFGRIKAYETCYELATVGVIPDYRDKNIGKEIVLRLIDKFPSRNVWIATDLAEYFKPFGFRIVKKGPRELHEKIVSAHCCRLRPGVKVMLLTKKGNG